MPDVERPWDAPKAPSSISPILAWVERHPLASLALAIAVVVAVFWIGWDLTGPHGEDAKSSCHNVIEAELPEPDLAVWGFSEQVDSFDSGWDVSGSVSEQGHDWSFTCSVDRNGHVLSHYLNPR